MDFKIKDKVTSVLDPTFLGIITTIHTSVGDTLYGTSYFRDGEPVSTNFYAFELAPATPNPFGFVPPETADKAAGSI
jgi:hypothetical protein